MLHSQMDQMVEQGGMTGLLREEGSPPLPVNHDSIIVNVPVKTSEPSLTPRFLLCPSPVHQQMLLFYLQPMSSI